MQYIVLPTESIVPCLEGDFPLELPLHSHNADVVETLQRLCDTDDVIRNAVSAS